MRKAFALLAALVAWGLSAPGLLGAASARDSAPAAAAESDEQKAAFKVLDALFARIDALLEKISDPPYKAQAKASVDALKERREALRRNFAQGTYEDLKFDATIDHHRIASWLEEASVKRLPGSGETRGSQSAVEKRERQKSSGPLQGRIARPSRGPSHAIGI